MRVFAAIPFGEEEREILESLQGALSTMPALADFRWARAGGVHLTLRFLGDVEEARAEAAADALRLAGEGASAFEVPLERFGVFPHLKRPNALWVGPEETPAPLAEFEARLSRRLAEAGFPAEDRPFRPHMTLARRRSRDRPLPGLEGELEIAERRWLASPPVCRAREAVLFRSELGPEGAVHTTLAKAGLG